MLLLDTTVTCSVLNPNLHFYGQIVRFSHKECEGGNLPFKWILKPHPHLCGGIDDFF